MQHFLESIVQVSDINQNSGPRIKKLVNLLQEVPVSAGMHCCYAYSYRYPMNT